MSNSGKALLENYEEYKVLCSTHNVVVQSYYDDMWLSNLLKFQRTNDRNDLIRRNFDEN